MGAGGNALPKQPGAPAPPIDSHFLHRFRYSFGHAKRDLLGRVHRQLESVGQLVESLGNDVDVVVR